MADRESGSRGSGPQISGPTITHKFLDREEEIIAVNKKDLLLIKDRDSMSTFYNLFGMFLLSGSVWMLIEHSLVQTEPFKMTTLLWICVICSLFGLIFLCLGWREHLKKQDFIEDMFKSTREIPSGTTITT